MGDTVTGREKDLSDPGAEKPKNADKFMADSTDDPNVNGKIINPPFPHAFAPVWGKHWAIMYNDCDAYRNINPDSGQAAISLFWVDEKTPTNAAKFPFRATGKLVIKIGTTQENDDCWRLALKDIKVDLDVDSDYDSDIDDEDDSDEVDSGGVLFLDNEDNIEAGGENNLEPIEISLKPKVDEGTLRLEIISGSDKIRIWKDSTKKNELNFSDNDNEWDLACEQPPSTLYVEGIKPSISRGDIQIQLVYSDNQKNSVSDIIALTVIAVEIEKLDMVDNPINPLNKRYLGLSKWRSTPQTSADKYACGEAGADILVRCFPDDFGEKLPLKLTLDINGNKKILHEGEYAGGEHKIKLEEKINGKIGKYKLEAKWGKTNIDEREDYWFLKPWGSQVRINGWEIDSDAFLKKYEMYVKIASLLKKFDMLPSAFTKWEPEKWHLKIRRVEGLSHKVWCDHDCPVHDHEKEIDKRLCEYAYSSTDYNGSTDISYADKYDAAEALASMMINATSIGQIPSVAGVDISGQIAGMLANSLKQSSGINANGQLNYGGGAYVDLDSRQYYYPCYVFEPFLGDNRDNQWNTGKINVDLNISVGARLNLKDFWAKEIDGKTLEKLVVEAGFLGGADSVVLPQLLRVGVYLQPQGYWSGSGKYTRRVTDVNNRPVYLHENEQKFGVSGYIGFVLYWELKIFRADGYVRTQKHYKYAYFDRNLNFKYMEDEKRKYPPKIPRIRKNLKKTVNIFAKEGR